MKAKNLVLTVFFVGLILSCGETKKETKYVEKELNPPNAPSGLEATAASSSQIDISWKDNSDNEGRFELWRKVQGGTWGLIGEKGADKTSFSDSGLVPETAYYYRVCACNIDGCSDYSNEANATTEGQNGGTQITWARTYGGSDYDIAHSIQQTSDGGYIVAGYTNSFGTGGSYDFWILKLNQDGDIVWDKTYGGSDREEAYSIQQTSDGGYIVAGYTDSSGAGDFWILKLDENGNLSWDKTYGGASYDKAHSIQQTSDGGYILAGCKSSGSGIKDFWILRLDESGNLLWDRTYGGIENDEAFSVQQTLDEGYVVAGWTKSFGAGQEDFWILKLNEFGNKIWDKTYGGSDRERAYSIQQTSDGGYIVAGNTDSSDQGDFWILRLDESGNAICERAYGGSGTEGPWFIQQTKDGGFIVSGYTSPLGVSSSSIWVLKLDENLNLTWDKTYGGINSESAYSIQQTLDGGYIVAGLTSSFGAGSYDFWILKLDENGDCPGCF